MSDLGEHKEAELLYCDARVRGKRSSDPRLELSVRGLARALDAQGRPDTRGAPGR
jgi:hypothetical protein